MTAQEPRTVAKARFLAAYREFVASYDDALAEAREQGEVSREPELRALMSELTGERALADRLAAALEEIKTRAAEMQVGNLADMSEPRNDWMAEGMDIIVRMVGAKADHALAAYRAARAAEATP